MLFCEFHKSILYPVNILTELVTHQLSHSPEMRQNGGVFFACCLSNKGQHHLLVTPPLQRNLTISKSIIQQDN